MENKGWRSPSPSTARIGVLGGDFPWCPPEYNGYSRLHLVVSCVDKIFILPLQCF